MAVEEQKHSKEVIKKIDAGGQGIWVCDKYVKGTDNFR